MVLEVLVEDSGAQLLRRVDGLHGHGHAVREAQPLQDDGALAFGQLELLRYGRRRHHGFEGQDVRSGLLPSGSDVLREPHKR